MTTKETLTLGLIPVGPEHAAAWLRWRNEAASRRFNPLMPLTVNELARRLASYYGSDLRDRTRAEYRWMVQMGGEVVGTVSASNASWTMGYVEIGYMMGEAHQGQGLGTRAVRLLVEKLLRETDVHRIFATVSVENIPSCRLLERLGFTREGVLREHYLIQGRRIDEVVYGLLRHEWKS